MTCNIIITSSLITDELQTNTLTTTSLTTDNLSTNASFPIVGRYYENNNMHLLTLQKTASGLIKRNG